MTEFQWVALAVILILSAARFTRLLTIDDFPPVRSVMDWYEDSARENWAKLAYCPYCMGPWVTIALGLWGYLTDWQEAWWVVNGIAAASYVASIIVATDKDS